MRDQGWRTFFAVAAGLAVIYFGVTGRSGEETGISSGLLVLAVAAAALVWWLTRPAPK